MQLSVKCVFCGHQYGPVAEPGIVGGDFLCCRSWSLSKEELARRKTRNRWNMAFDKILVVDDELIIRKTFEAHLRRRRYAVASAKKLEEAKRLLARDHFDLVFLDVRLPDGEGTELLECYADDPNAPMMVIITGFGTIESAVQCMRRGAFDYLVKPCSIDQMEIILKKAEAYSQLVKVNRYFSSQILQESELIGKSRAMVHLRKMIRKVAATEATVLITGENGTGKELVARELFRLSPLAERPYIRVNCASISENLIESEFFGHEKGSFTGANQRREGRFELANNGTILLDEIGEIAPRVQAKLLRVLQEQEFERVGGNRTIRVNVRVLATTNRDLVAAVGRGEFREDLYYRLNVFPIAVPALRDRSRDIPALAETFLHRFTRKHGISVPGFSEDALDYLTRHQWPGNVRELQNSIERAVILAEKAQPVSIQSLGLLPTVPSNVAGRSIREFPGNGAVASGFPEANNHESDPACTVHATGDNAEDGFMTLDELEKVHILEALKRTGGRRTETADMLKITTRTLRNKVNQYRSEGIHIP